MLWLGCVPVLVLVQFQQRNIGNRMLVEVFFRD
jgi:hypothetical protein